MIDFLLGIAVCGTFVWLFFTKPGRAELQDLEAKLSAKIAAVTPPPPPAPVKPAATKKKT